MTEVLLTSRSVRRWSALAAAGALGFALILWIAANWDSIGKLERFAIPAAALAAGGIAALASQALFAPGLLVSFLATGGLLALIGQTYQTGADAWQLFALWAALGLPFVLAARSDVIWTPWVAVAMTALVLWQSTTDIARHFITFAAAPGGTSAGLPLLLASWLPALALTAALAPRPFLDAVLGGRLWAFRLAALLTFANVAGWGVAGAVSGSMGMLSYAVASLAVLAACGTALLGYDRKDPLLLAALALAVDVVLIALVVRLVLPHASPDASTFFLTGILSAGIVAASVVAVLAALRAGETAISSIRNAATSMDDARPWAVTALSACGALIAAIPLTAAISILLGPLLMLKGPGALLAGLIVCGGSIWSLRRAGNLFVEQLASIVLATGMGLVIYALFRDLPVSFAAFVLAVALLALALWLSRPWLAAILGAGAAVALAVGFTTLFSNAAWPGTRLYLLTWAVMAGGWSFLVLALEANRQWLEPLPGSRTLDATLTGAGAAVLLALSVGGGPTFMLDGLLGTGMTRVHQATGGNWVWLTAQSVVGVVLGAAGGLLMLRTYQALREPLGYLLVAVGVALCLAMPALGPAVLMLAIGLANGRRALALLAAVAVLWIFGNFYYALALTLAQKAAILAAAGTVVGMAAYISGVVDDIAVTGKFYPVPIASRALVAAGLLVSGGVGTQAILAKEALIRDGRPVFVELIPVDPRSLMQGDYMALRFRLPDGMRKEQVPGARPHVVGRTDAKGVLQLTRFADARDPIGSGETRIELVRAARGWTLVTNAWYFKEGTAAKWQGARYGEFRVTPDGRALLVSLADKDLQPLR